MYHLFASFMKNCRRCGIWIVLSILVMTTVLPAQIVKLKDYTNYKSAPIGSYQGIPVREGGFSGLTVIPGTNGKEYWTVSDRGPNIDCGSANPAACPMQYDKLYAFPNYGPKIHRIRVNGDSVQILQTIPIRRPGGTPATGLLLPTGLGTLPTENASFDTVMNCANFASKLVSKDAWGIDSEGLLVDRDGNFWVCEEGGASIWKINPNGYVLKRYTPYANVAGAQPEDVAIDTVFGYRKNNRGFEGICMTPNGKIYAFIQSPILFPTQSVGEASRIHRILEIDPSTNAMRMLAYLNDGVIGSGSNSIRLRDWKLGDAAAINDSTMLILEAAARGTTDIKRMYLVNINGATAVHSGLYGTVTLEGLVDSTGLANNGIVPVRKTLFMDLLASGWPSAYDKAEGLTILNDSTIAICNDNDYGVVSLPANGIATATNLPCHLVTFGLQGSKKLVGYTPPPATPVANVVPGLDYSFVVLGCNRVEDVDSVGNPSTANVYQLNRVFSEVAAMNPLPRYLFFAGDMVLGYEADTVKLANQLTAWLGLYKAHPISKLPITLVAIPGNHETQNKAAGKKSFVAAERTFQRVMYDYLQGNNGPRITGLLPGTDSLTTDQSKLSYSFDYKNDHFVILNTDPVGRDNIASYKWASADVAAARAAGVRHVFAVGHKPAYTGHFKTTADGLETIPAQRDSLWSMFEAQQVDAFFSAHVHCADSIQPHAGKTWQVIAGNGGSLVEALFQNPPNAYFGYVHVKVYSSNRVNVTSLGRDAVMTAAAYQNATPNNPTTVRASYDININPSIDHTPRANTNDIGPFTVVATIKDNIAVTAAQLNYFVNGVAQTPLQPTISGTTYTFRIPAQAGSGVIEYNIQANDASLIKIYSSGAANQYHRFEYGFSLVTGLSSTRTPYLSPVANGVKFTSLMSATDTASNGYRMVGIPDGLGAFDNNDGTFTVLMNHEIGSGLGVARAHGSNGAFVSKLIINKTDMSVVSGQDLIRSVYLWSAGTYTKVTASSPSAAASFNRFCSADLPPVNAFYNPLTGLGTQERLFMNGEEAGDNGRLFAHIATGINAGTSYELPSLGKFSCENLLARPVQGDKTVVVGLDDSTPGQVYFYIGTKVSVGNEIDKAGLSNGKLYGVAVSGLAAENTSTPPAANTVFSLIDLGNVRDSSGTGLNTLSNAKGVTTFLRPEDGAWDPQNPADFYFNTTNSFSAPSRVYRLRFSNIQQPELGGTITAVIDGTEGVRMLDNMCIDNSGHILLQEDVGNNSHNGKVWQYTIATDSLKLIAQHDTTRFILGGSQYLTQDEESSGIIDVQSILGPGKFLLVDQAHYPIAGEVYEGGQLLLMTNPDSYNGALGAGPNSSQSPYLTPIASGVKFGSILSTPDVVNGYKMVGIPDGLGAFDNNDGTFTLLMNHEIPSGSGINRAHGSNGAFVSKWRINKSDMRVISGGDLIRTVNMWNGKGFTTYNAFNASTLTSFNRFCSADLPAANALFNTASGRGTTERIFFNGEEAGDNGRLFAHIVTGSFAGVSYELPWLGKFSCENVVARPMSSDKTVVAAMDDTTPGQVYFYIGSKTTEGLEIDKAGLTNGRLYGVAVDGLANESSTGIPAANTNFRLVDLGNVRDSSGTALNALSNAKGVTNFLRPEDGAWDPANPRDMYFVTTNSFTSPSRLWRLRFLNPESPEAGGTITAVLDGTEGVKMLDNMTIDNYGHIILQEDVGNNAHIGKVWQYTIATDSLKLLGQHDTLRFITGAPNYLTQDEEASGVIDAQSILGPGYFLMVDQAHYSIPGDAYEGGQLLTMFNPDTYNAAMGAGPSSSQSPYLTPVAPGVRFTSLLSVGDVARNGYAMSGLPDGLGAFDNGNGTFTLLVNHEIGANAGVVRAHGSNSAFVSKWVINNSDLSIVSGADLIRNVKLWNGSTYVTYNSSNPSSLATFVRFCSADLPPVSAFYNAASGLGTQERLFMNGEESGDNGRMFAHIASGTNAGTSYELPWLGKYSCENLLASPVQSDKTVVAGLDDSTPGQVYFYVGTKTNSGTEIDKAGLSNGRLYGVAVSGMSTEVSATFPTANTAFSLVDLGVVRDSSGTALNALSNQKAVTTFLRPEDGSWDPSSPSDFYFNTTNSFTGPSRVWRLRFTDPKQPELGGTISVILNGTEGIRMLDNMTIDKYGHLLLQEDVGNNVHNGKIWQYTLATSTLTLLAQHDSTRFELGGSRFLTLDEESSGVIDMQSILGPGYFLTSDQAHYAIPGSAVEGGQLLLMYNPSTFASSAEISVKANNLEIVRNDNNPTPLNNTDFGTVALTKSSTRTYTIYNTGGADLVINNITFAGANPTDFIVDGTQTFPMKINGNGYRQVVIRFNPTDVGTRSATMTILSNDYDESSYSFAIKGNAYYRTIVAKGNNFVIESGSQRAISTNNTDFGTIGVGKQVTHSFMVFNSGASDLSLTALSLLNNDGSFSIESTLRLPQTIKPHTSVPFSVSFNPKAPGASSATLQIQSDAIDYPTYSFVLSGSAIIVKPVLVVSGNGQTIASGDLQPSPSDNTDFGTLRLGVHKVLDFSITNTGNDSLSIAGVSIEGPQAGDFLLGPQPVFPYIIAMGGREDLSIRFAPVAAGLRTARVVVRSSDTQHADYSFAIQGRGEEINDVALDEQTQIRIVPQPAIDRAELSFSLDVASKVELRLYDNSGSEVLRHSYGEINAGTQHLNLPTSELSAGVYTLQLMCGTEVRRVQLVIMH